MSLGRTRGGKGGEDATPHKVFLSFFLEDKTSVPDVFRSCSFIPRAHFTTSFVMVSCYGYQRHHPLNIPHLVKKIKGFPPKVKAFQNTATYQKLWGGVHSRAGGGGGGGGGGGLGWGPFTPRPPPPPNDLSVVRLHNKERAVQSNLSANYGEVGGNMTIFLGEYKKFIVPSSCLLYRIMVIQS